MNGNRDPLKGLGNFTCHSCRHCSNNFLFILTYGFVPVCHGTESEHVQLERKNNNLRHTEVLDLKQESRPTFGQVTCICLHRKTKPTATPIEVWFILCCLPACCLLDCSDATEVCLKLSVWETAPPKEKENYRSYQQNVCRVKLFTNHFTRWYRAKKHFCIPSAWVILPHPLYPVVPVCMCKLFAKLVHGIPAFLCYSL